MWVFSHYQNLLVIIYPGNIEHIWTKSLKVFCVEENDIFILLGAEN